MPLHLLGKKSWNVYNLDNVERVRRDEADARARQEADEQRMQEEDAARRIALLRGQKPAPLPEPGPVSPTHKPRQPHEPDASRERVKRRRLKGEDDTDREIRFAREDAAAAAAAAAAGQGVGSRLAGSRADDTPLLDCAGHIQLVPVPDATAGRKAEKNAEAEAEKAKKRRREEDQVTMRFSNAAGYRSGMQKPWYAAESSPGEDTRPGNALVLAEAEGKDVWGNEDPRRKEREMNRIVSSDPFAMMQQAQKQLKQSEKDRGKWKDQREQELRELERDQERKRKHDKKRSRRQEEEDKLDGFSLDTPLDTHARDRHSSDGHRRHHRRHRHRSRERERSRSRERRHR